MIETGHEVVDHEGRRIRIGFLASLDSGDPRAWSGTYYHMARALETHGGDVIRLGPAHSRFKFIHRCVHRLAKLVLRKGYGVDHNLFLARDYARIFGRRLQEEPCDVVFAPAASTEIAFLETDLPIVYLSDATFRLMTDYYPSFSNLLSVSIEHGNLIERLAIKKASLLLFSTRWAAQSAIRDYGADKSRVHVIPFGANIEDIPPAETVVNRESDCCRLLFVGRDWGRKGGDIAVETLLGLEDLGVEAHLTICGCTPPKGVRHERMTVVPFEEDVGRQMSGANFLLLPTRNECSPIAFSEASAFGLPIITTDTGGVAEIVRDGENGFALPLNATGPDYARIICDIWGDPGRYESLAKSSRRAYDQRLNWQGWAEEVGSLVRELLEKRSPLHN